MTLDYRNMLIYEIGEKSEIQDSPNTNLTNQTITPHSSLYFHISLPSLDLRTDHDSA